MILYFKDKFETIFAVDSSIELNEIDLKKLEWLFVAKHINQSSINSNFIGPKKNHDFSLEHKCSRNFRKHGDIRNIKN